MGHRLTTVSTNPLIKTFPQTAALRLCPWLPLPAFYCLLVLVGSLSYPLATHTLSVHPSPASPGLWKEGLVPGWVFLLRGVLLKVLLEESGGGGGCGWRDTASDELVKTNVFSWAHHDFRNSN